MMKCDIHTLTHTNYKLTHECVNVFVGCYYILQPAAVKRKFEMIVVESAPLYQGQELATKLAKEGVETTLITDSAVSAIMSRVNKMRERERERERE